MMDPTEGLEDQQTSILNEIIGRADEKEIVLQHIGTITELLLRRVVVEMNVEKFSDRIVDS